MATEEQLKKFRMQHPILAKAIDVAKDNGGTSFVEIMAGGSVRVSKKQRSGKFYLPAGGPTRASIRRRVNRAAKRGDKQRRV